MSKRKVMTPEEVAEFERLFQLPLPRTAQQQRRFRKLMRLERPPSLEDPPRAPSPSSRRQGSS